MATAGDTHKNANLTIFKYLRDRRGVTRAALIFGTIILNDLIVTRVGGYRNKINLDNEYSISLWDHIRVPTATVLVESSRRQRVKGPNRRNKELSINRKVPSNIGQRGRTFSFFRGSLASGAQAPRRKCARVLTATDR